MEYLYLGLNLGSFLIPFLFSFHPRLQFHKKWRSFFPAVGIMMLVFIPWDIIFTSEGFWGFNEDYITGLHVLGLPIEEWLFFICIPYACIFTYYALQELLPRLMFSERITSIICVSLFSVLIVTLWYYYDRWYTLVNFIYGMLLLGWVHNYNRSLLQRFLPFFLIIQIPFFLVNGILTGTGLPEPVVWYNNTENLGIRMITIPIEDVIYNLGMLLTVLFFTEKLEKQHAKR
ncbi:lycopene cyclase domain-containing protein [Flavobacteriaceae bacterium TK19130]|nr:lycopene cyclase domain-containing protein [Thermobacterium salinum]